MAIKSCTNIFVNKAIAKHGNSYDYSLVEYENNQTKIAIICHKHDVFWQTPNCHLKGQGCPQCGKIKSVNSRKDTTESFIKKAKKKHNNKYDYSKVKYYNQKHKVKIVCPIHGEFEQPPTDHLQGHGCLECGRGRSVESLFLTTEEFIIKAKLIHGNKFDYSEVDYKSTHDKITIICSKHGKFEQQPNVHLNNHGCPNCPATTSSGHKELLDFIKSMVDTIENDKTTIKPFELDMFIPSLKLGIEYDGLYWHSAGDIVEDSKRRRKQFNKVDLCNKNNIRLIQIREDEWLNKKEIVKSIVSHAIKKSSSRIYARKCSIKQLSNKEYEIFIENNHIQGHKSASVKFGLEYDNKIVMVMSFNKHPKHEWEITRMASLIGHSIVGGASKLFKNFIKTQSPKSIMTFADRRYATGLTYKHLGFKLDYITNPNYIYVKNKKVFSRQHFQKGKQKDKLKIFDPTKSERENMFINKYRRYWDSGNMKFLWSGNNDK